ncbi:metallophosphoesterase family protein [Halochromatium sp.]
MKFIHSADIHLDSPLSGLERYEGAPVDAIRGASRRAFENLIQLAIDEQVAFVLLAGDLFDGDWRDYNTGLFFVRQILRLKEAAIPVFVVAGNHDAASQMTKTLRPPENLHLFATRAPESCILEEQGVAIHGQGFATRAVTEDLTAKYPLANPDYFNIGLLHTALDGRPGHEAYAPCTLDGLRSRGYQYWALGHVHRREVVAEAPWVVFPGNLQGRHARETGPKGCSLVEVDEGQVVSVEHRPLDVVRWTVCDLDLSEVQRLDELYDRVGPSLAAAVSKAEGRMVAARLRLHGPCPIHTRLRAEQESVVNECRALAESVGSGAIWIEKLVLETEQESYEDAALERDDAFSGLLRSIRDLDLDAERLAALSEDFADLSAKLPPALRCAPDAIDPADPEQLRARLEDVKALLIERLLREGRRP